MQHKVGGEHSENKIVTMNLTLQGKYFTGEIDQNPSAALEKDQCNLASYSLAFLEMKIARRAKGDYWPAGCGCHNNPLVCNEKG